jgi:N-formylglutamate deformylase
MTAESVKSTVPPWVTFHVPHDSKVIPNDIRASFTLTDENLARELALMTDHHTLDLYTRGVPREQILAAEVSRLVVDVERYLDDMQEPMSKVGMGAIYTYTHDGQRLRSTPSHAERQRLIDQWYLPHHQRLEDHVSSSLSKHGIALILDCHSYSSRCLPHESNLPAFRPEICLGTDNQHTDLSITKYLMDFFRQAGLEVGINTPFSGTIVPTSRYGRDHRVQSIMIEVRRDLYMDELTGEGNRNYEKIRRTLRDCISALEDNAGSTFQEV